MGIEAWKIPCGKLSRGIYNKITDVPGVKVGHTTLRNGEINTGVTVILPCEDNAFTHKLIATAYVHNGFGKTLGSVQMQELGTLETPIALTNTLNVGLVHDALVDYTLDRCQAEGVKATSVNAVVGECNDSQLNAIGLRSVKAAHVREAIDAACLDFEEGNVGGGTGTLCYGFKGGIGSASRVIKIGGEKFTIGILVQSNFGATADLIVGGEPVGKELAKIRGNGWAAPTQTDQGSIMTVLATDLPVTSRQLYRIVRRTGVGLARTGSYVGHGSGEIMLAFTTANRVPANSEEPFISGRYLRDDLLDVAFRAAAEAEEEAVLSSMLHAKAAYGLDGRYWPSLADFFSEKQR